MKKFENIIILKTRTKIENVENLINDIKKTLSPENIKAFVFIGKRKLAYEVKGKKEGFYIFIQYEATDQTARIELERIERLNEDILKFINIQVREFEQQEGAIKNVII